MSGSISASTAASGSSAYRNLRISGLASGLDTESIIEKLMEAEKAKVFKIEQEKTMAEWRQAAYREVIGLIRDFMNDQFSLTNSAKSILSASGYKSVSVSGASGAAVILAGGEAANGAYTINAIDQLAAASTVQSGGKCVEFITGSADLSSGTIALEGTSFNLRLDGVQKTISFDSDYEDLPGLTADLQAKVDDAFGTGRVTVGSAGGMLTLSASHSTLLALSDTGGTDALATLGIAPGARNVVNLSASVAETFGTSEDIAFAINGVSFAFSATDSIASMIKAVNDSAAGVTLSYSSLSDGFTLSSCQTGSASQIVIENTSGNLFGAGGAFKIDTGVVRNGRDAIFYLNDADLSDPIVRSENVFAIDGVTFSLKRETSEAVHYEVYDDVDAAKAKIESFVSGYNALLARIADILGEQRDYDYAPLSDEQKDKMSDDEIARWEAKAKQGILESDTLLSAMYNRMRTAFVSAIQGAATSFAQCGITTSLYTQKGQLVIDDAKLTAALEKDIGGVMELFAMSSDIGYSRDLTSGQAAERFDESGFAQRINDILKDYVATKRNAGGYKGLLLEKAGLEGDTTEFSNTISKLIEDLEKKIEEANKRKDDQEDRYWEQFSALERAINTMNSQSSWITSMLGS